MDKDKSTVISKIVTMLLEGNETAAKTIIRQEYPHTYFELEKRTYTMMQKMNQFISDGFIDSNALLIAAPVSAFVTASRGL